MCECGCGDFNAQYRFAGPQGYTYALSVTPGCLNCGTPAGIIIHRADAARSEQWNIGELPELPFRGFSDETAPEWADYYQAIADPALILDELRKAAAQEAELDQEERCGSPDEFLEFEGMEAIADGIDATLDRYESKVSP